LGAGATIGRLPHLKHAQDTDATTSDVTRAAGSGHLDAERRAREHGCQRPNYPPAPRPSNAMSDTNCERTFPHHT